MKKRAIQFLVSAVLAGALTAGLLYAVSIPSKGPTIFSLLCLPFYMIGMHFSGSIHQPETIATFLSMFLFFFIITFGLIVVASKLFRRRTVSKNHADPAA
jgi:hypothetical protein